MKPNETRDFNGFDSSGKHERFSMFVRTKNELLGTHSFSLGFHHETDGLSMKTSPDGSKLVQNWCMMLEGASHLANMFTPSYMEYPHSNIIYMGLYVIYI